METADELAPEEELDFVLRHARELDPTVSKEALQQFILEIAEMEAALDSLDVADAPLETAFSPTWPASQR